MVAALELAIEHAQRRLERSLGSQLLHRTTRRLHLTAAGAALLPEAQALQTQAQRARQAVRSLQDEVAGTVRLTVPVSLGETFFDALLLDFASRYPRVRVELDLAAAAPSESRARRGSPSELFAEYLAGDGIEDPRVVKLFEQLYDEAVAGAGS